MLIIFNLWTEIDILLQMFYWSLLVQNYRFMPFLKAFNQQFSSLLFWYSYILQKMGSWRIVGETLLWLIWGLGAVAKLVGFGVLWTSVRRAAVCLPNDLSQASSCYSLPEMMSKVALFLKSSYLNFILRSILILAMHPSSFLRSTLSAAMKIL